MIINRTADNLLIKIPIYLPIIYGLFLYNFNNYENAIIFLTLLFLAEPHFGATWPFFLHKKNLNYIRDKKITLIVAPIIIAISSIFLFFYYSNFFYFIFLIYNMFHVTRQSVGISKLFVKVKSEVDFQDIVIKIFGIIFFIVAILRFYLNNTLVNENLLIFNISIIVLILFSLSFYIFKFKLSENIYTLITGILIFYPICFVDKPVHGIIMGVTMHYAQYLCLTYKVALKRLIDEGDFNKNIKIEKKYISLVLFYGLIMAILSLTNNQNVIEANLGFLLCIPLTGQILHFYLDSFLWKFSEEHNRDVTLKYLKD